MTDLIDRLRGAAPSIMAMRDAASEIESLTRQREAYRRANESLSKEADSLRALVHQLGAKAIYVYDNLQDDGDRCYLGSTNHADVLEKAKKVYDEYRLETGDMGQDDAI